MRVLWLLGLVVLLLTGCGEDADPTRSNDFVPLTSIRIEAPYPNLAKRTAGQFEAFGDYSGLFERKITDQVFWAVDNPSPGFSFDPTRPGWGMAGEAEEVTISATLSDITGTFPFTVTNAEITGLTIEPATLNLPVGLARQLTATGTFGDAGVITTQDLTSQLDWRSNAPEFVSVDGNGLARALVASDPNPIVEITATFDEFINIVGAAQITVTVAELQSIQVSVSNGPLLVGETRQFTATGTYSNGDVVDLTSHADINWTSSTPTVATVGAKTGTVSAVASGSASIVATMDVVSGSTPIEVLVPSAITVTPANPALARGATQQMTATATFGTNGSREVTNLVSWLSTDTAVATVDSSGLVRSFVSGSSTIRASLQNTTGETRLTVLP